MRNKSSNSVEVRYDSDIYRMSDGESHRNIKYATPGTITQLIAIYQYQMKRYVQTHAFIVPLIMVLLVPIGGIIVHRVENRIGSIGLTPDSFPMMLLTLMPIGILFIVNRYTSKIISTDFSEKTGFINLTLPVRRSTNLLGKYFAAFTMVVLTLLILYILVAAVTVVFYGSVTSGLWTSLIIAVAFAFAYTSLNMLLNTVRKSQSMLMYAIVFIGIPLLFILMVYMNYATMSMLQYVFPLADAIVASIGTGFGGFSLFTMVTLFVQTPPISISLMNSVLLGIAWGLILLAASIILYQRKEI